MLTKAHIRFIADLRQRKSFRDQHQLFIAEGPKVVLELLTAPNVYADEIYATDEWLAAHHYLVVEKSRFSMEVTATELGRLSGLTTPNHVVGVFHVPDFSDDAAQSNSTNVSLALDTIQDPGNLGTIIRTADWFGIRRIFCSLTCADAFNPKVVQSTMGSLARVQVVYQDLEAVLQLSKATIYAGALQGEALQTLTHDSRKASIVLIGNESRGISPELLKLATQKITIPRHGEAESLNAAVATGIILSHLNISN